ncbi:MAG: molybdopterin-dependent oxidoreductase [Desulfobacterales bacterium]|nr:molybdopterin-dependent oxidoreductase [Desulfobacterales bacterium]
MVQRFSRRIFLAWLGRLTAWSAALAWLPLSNAWAAVKRKLLPATTSREALAKMAPPLIDAGQIPSTPIEQFGVMGSDDEHLDMARWRLAMAGVAADARELVATGADGVDDTQRRFSLDAVRAEKVYLCYAVNGQALPVKHGFPLRIVAEEEFGDQWLKYVFKLEVA